MGLDPDAKAAAGQAIVTGAGGNGRRLSGAAYRGEILKWARKENAHVGSRRPIGLIETDAGAVEVFDYIDGYIRNQLDEAGDQDDLSSRS